MTKRYHFVQADVFTAQPFGGNQLAVFTDARGLTVEEMQTLTREMNFSECTFVLPPEIPGALKRVRIFTPGKELPMAGHPTVGTTFVLAQRAEFQLTAERTEVTLQLGIGPVRVAVERTNGAPGFVWMNHRPPEFGTIVANRQPVADALGLPLNDIETQWPVQRVSTGLPWLFVPLTSLDAARRCRPDQSALQSVCEHQHVEGLVTFTAEVVSAQNSFHVRAFPTPEDRIPEDPATGSAAAPFGAYVARYGLLPRAPAMRFACEQGLEMKRASQIHIHVGCQAERITELMIGGSTVIVAEGEIFWD